MPPRREQGSDGACGHLLHKVHRNTTVVESPTTGRMSVSAGELALDALVEARDVDHNALVRATADRLLLVARLDPERQRAPFDRGELGGRFGLHADRGRGKMADVEMDAEALVAGGQQMLDRGERGRLDQVDHD